MPSITTPTTFIFLLLLPILTTSEYFGYTCTPNATLYPCSSLLFYRPPSSLPDLAAVADLFYLPRPLIATASNLTSVTTPLLPSQPLLIPLPCSCVRNHSYSLVPYKIKKGDTYYFVSTSLFSNLTAYQDVIELNPTLVAENLDIGVMVNFPLFCGCSSRFNVTVITYVLQPGETVAEIGKRFGADLAEVEAVNKGRTIGPFRTVLVPVSNSKISLANFGYVGGNSSNSNAPPPAGSTNNSTIVGQGGGGGDGRVVGLGVAVGVLGILLVGVLGVLVRKRKGGSGTGDARKVDGIGEYNSISDGSLNADIVDCLDKYRVFQMEEIRRATGDFDPKSLVSGSVYKGAWNGCVYAIKRMKWNAWQELRILQKVNHTNLVKLEGFCIDPEDGTCYLVYEYVENGSLDTWLHESSKKSKLDWRKRLKISLDVANGLQYIHEHTWPTVVHKDVRSSNILLDEKMRAKIANFGLAKSGCNAMTTNIVGTQGYIAPEYLVDGLVTTKMDVFAYGVVLLELVTGKEAVKEDGEVLWACVEKVFPEKEIVGNEKLKSWMDRTLVEQGCPIDSVVGMMSVAKSCVQRDPSSRPNMMDIVYTLSKACDLYATDFSMEESNTYSDLTPR